MGHTTTALVSKSLNIPPKLEQVAVEELRPNEALIEIAATGICHTDLSVMNGTIPSQFPCVLGHEGNNPTAFAFVACDSLESYCQWMFLAFLLWRSVSQRYCGFQHERPYIIVVLPRPRRGYSLSKINSL